METRSERLKTLIRKLNITQVKFAEETSINDKLLSRYLNGLNFGEKIASKVTNCYPQFNRVWLLDGQGDMFVTDKNEEYVKSASKYDIKNPDNQAEGEDIASNFVPDNGLVIHNNKALERLETKIGSVIKLIEIASRKNVNSKTPQPVVTDLLNESINSLKDVVADINKQKERYSNLLKMAKETSIHN